jgi:hypothetical protein
MRAICYTLLLFVAIRRVKTKVQQIKAMEQRPSWEANCSKLFKKYFSTFCGSKLFSKICRDWPTHVLICMLLYLHDGYYMFRQNNAILREQLGSFLNYFNVSMVGVKCECNKYEQRTMTVLTFRNPASYIKDGHTFNTPHFLYFFNK